MVNSGNQVKRLTVDDIEVPEGMLGAFAAEFGLSTIDDWERALASALLWLAEHPIVPSEGEAESMKASLLGRRTHLWEDFRDAPVEWQRRMFLRKPAALPEEVKKLLVDENLKSDPLRSTAEEVNRRIRKAYELGKAGAK